VNEGATPFGVGDNLETGTQGSPAMWRGYPGLRGATPLALFGFRRVVNVSFLRRELVLSLSKDFVDAMCV